MPKTKAAIKENKLSKGELRKLAALRKSLGDEIADEAFSKWHGQQKKVGTTGGLWAASPTLARARTCARR